MIKNRDYLLSFARFFDKEYNGNLPVCIGKTIISGSDKGNQIVEGNSFIRIDESNFFPSVIDTTNSAKAQTYTILIELFFKKENYYEDERSDVDEILISGFRFPLYDFSIPEGSYIQIKKVDAQEVEGANPILVNQDYQHYYWYVNIIRVYGG